MDLNVLREYLDVLDRSIRYILAKRMSIISLVAEYKIENNLPVRQPQREKEMFEEMRKFSDEVGLNPELIVNIYKLIIEDAVRMEHDMMNEKAKKFEKSQKPANSKNLMLSNDESLVKLKEFINLMESK